MRVGVAAEVAHRNLGVFAEAADDLRQFAAALFRERGQRHADQVARRRRVEAEVGITDRLFDDLDHALFPGLDGERVRVAHADLRDLVDRGRAAVVVDLDVVEKARRGAARADLREVLAERFNGAAHLVFGLLQNVGDHEIGSPNANAPEPGPIDRVGAVVGRSFKQIRLHRHPVRRVSAVGGGSQTMPLRRSILKAFRSGVHERAFPFAQEDAAQRPLAVDVEDLDRELLFAAEREGRRVHHLEVAVKRLVEGDFVEHRRRGIELRVGRVDAVDLRRLEDQLGADFRTAERRGRVRSYTRTSAASIRNTN